LTGAGGGREIRRRKPRLYLRRPVRKGRLAAGGERSSVAPWLLLPVHGRDKRGLVGWIQEGGMRAAGGRAEGTAEVDWRWAGGVRGERARGREGSQSSWAPPWDKLVSEGYANARKQNGHEMICFIVSDWLFKKLIF
jgi:hypothetical protein